MSELVKLLDKKKEYDYELKKINNDYLEINNEFRDKYGSLMFGKEEKLISRINDVLLDIGFNYQKKGSDKLYSYQNYHVLIRFVGNPSNIIIRNEENDEHLYMNVYSANLFDSTISYKAENKEEAIIKMISLKKELNTKFKTYVDNLTENDFLISLKNVDKHRGKTGATIFESKIIDDFILYLLQNYLPTILTI